MTEHEQLLQNLIEDCSAETAKAFFRRKNTAFSRGSKELDNTDPDRFANVRKFGQLDFEGQGDTVLFVFADVKADLTERSCRKAQFEVARKILQSENADAGLFIFKGGNGASRLSLVYKIYEGTKSAVSPYRRFTYFVQPDSTGNTTFKRQIYRCAFDSLDAIKQAFSIEAVSREFYRELSNWYFWALKHIRFPSQNDLPEAERNPVCTIRMITRLMFVWFMKQMNLIPPEFFDREKLETTLKSIDPEESTYYKAILQNLFFATLNTEMEHPKYPRRFRTTRDKGRDGSFGIHSVYRYKEMFCDSDATLDLFKTVPFLNGGLFECLDNTEVQPVVRIDGFSERKDNELHVPNFLFFGGEHIEDLSESYGDKKHKKEKVSGLLDILSRYNFTVIENTPHESEVALDPELLGMVFENLLASYNPETQTTARKQTGSFYTPREIVNYMVDESLIAYLKGKLNVDATSSSRFENGGPSSTSTAVAAIRDRGSSVAATDGRGTRSTPASTEEDSVSSVVENNLRSLLSYDFEGNPFDETETERLIDAMDACQILDPACGSGAFPMGVLHKLVLILSKLDPGNEQWLQKQIEKLDDVTMRDELARNFRENAEDYGRKLCLIENGIYGVDIQPIACQISKLRFFISLLCDQIVNPKKPNLGIRPLPNLETKFVAANTLIGIDRPQQMLLRNPEIDKLENELAKVRHEHFKARTPKTKRKYRELDDQLRHKIGDLLIGDGWIGKSARQVAEWNPYDQNASASFFDPEWMFAITDGFDIVIGNPPYIRIQTLKKNAPELVGCLKDHYVSAQKGNYDVYVVFVELGLKLLNEQGHLTYILPHKFFNAQYGELLRKLIADGQHLRHVVHFGDQQIFPGATNYVCLLFLSAYSTAHIRFARADDISAWLRDGIAVEGVVPACKTSSSEWNFVVGEAAGLFEKLSRMPTKLGDVTRIFVGVQTSADDVFIMNFISEADQTITLESKALDKTWSFEKTLLHPIVSGTDISPFIPLPARQFVLFPYRTVDEKAQLIPMEEIECKWPFTADYLKKNHARLAEREKGKLCETDRWHGYIYLKNMTRQHMPKLCVPRLVEFLQASSDFYGTHVLDNVDVGGVVFSDPEDRHSLAYLLALLNSRLLRWFFPHVSAPFRGGFRSANKQFLSLLPFQLINFENPEEKETHDSLAHFAEQMLTLKKENPEADTSALETEIDHLVYKLYDLTDVEIKIVEGRT